jgi:hypothetical protein
MAGLSIRTDPYELGFDSIGELKNVVAHSVLEAHRFTNVVNTPAEVAGDRNGCRLSVQYLHIAERSFWRVVTCACDSFENARAAVDEVVDAINDLHPL